MKCPICNKREATEKLHEVEMCKPCKTFEEEAREEDLEADEELYVLGL